ncbi:MAG: membrane integrity-associated transporter subunit PqiC [Campylobacterales bacterium]|nr:membrane integrity-associated transporter subunit PqiC [Campylobacterales bacterium]
MRWIVIVGIVLMMTGCALKPTSGQPTAQMRLGEVSTPKVASGFPYVLQVRPMAGSLDSTKLLYQTPDGLRRAYAHHRWEEPLSKQMQQLVVLALAQSAVFEDVVSTTSKARAQRVLENTVFAFEQYMLQGGASVVRLHVRARMVNVVDNASVAHRMFRIEMPVLVQTPAGALDAYNRAFEAWVRELTLWLASLGEAHAF